MEEVPGTKTWRFHLRQFGSQEWAVVHPNVLSPFHQYYQIGKYPHRQPLNHPVQR
jgi:hypothetical protein